jgi:hypothetical protein
VWKRSAYDSGRFVGHVPHLVHARPVEPIAGAFPGQTTIEENRAVQPFSPLLIRDHHARQSEYRRRRIVRKSSANR